MKTTIFAGALALLTATPALAADDQLEWWSDLTLSHDLDKKTFVEFQTQQRFRESPAGDSHIYRIWLGRKISKATSLSLGLHRSKEGADLETRIIEQASYTLDSKLGLKGRTRLEQRMIDGRDRTGWRLRQRIGVAIPLTDKPKDWALAANAEGFFTLRATSATGDTGLTGLRTFVGFQKTFGKMDLGVGYTRQQSIRKNRPDVVGHAPTLNLTFKL
ncbi:DUF2490 domain-containing protein [Sphingomonas rosea]